MARRRVSRLSSIPMEPASMLESPAGWERWRKAELDRAGASSKAAPKVQGTRSERQETFTMCFIRLYRRRVTARYIVEAKVY